MIRNIRIEDAQPLENICRTSLGHETTAALLTQRIQELSEDPFYYIGGNGWNVIALAVSETAQNQGIGKQLLTSLEKLAARESYTFVRLNCNTIRTEAHMFYERMGYVCDKTQKRFIKAIGQ